MKILNQCLLLAAVSAIPMNFMGNGQGHLHPHERLPFDCHSGGFNFILNPDVCAPVLVSPMERDEFQSQTPLSLSLPSPSPTTKLKLQPFPTPSLPDIWDDVSLLKSDDDLIAEYEAIEGDDWHHVDAEEWRDVPKRQDSESQDLLDLKDWDDVQ